jgi:hypothetical protein
MRTDGTGRFPNRQGHGVDRADYEDGAESSASTERNMTHSPTSVMIVSA